MIPAELKALKKVKKNGSLPESDIPNVSNLLRYGVIARNCYDEQDKYGNYISNGTVSVTDKYDRYVSEHRWFTPEYVLSHLAIPLASAVIGGIITALIGS